MAAGSGKQLCGRTNNGWDEEKIKVKCSADAVNGQFTVRVYTQLNSVANGIDNVVLKQLSSYGGGFKTITANFQDAKDFEGFNRVKIADCGSLAKIRGGYNTKAKGHDIKKTFEVPKGTYWVTLDFIKIDSWLVKYR